MRVPWGVLSMSKSAVTSDLSCDISLIYQGGKPVGRTYEKL
jgi:hypothetical protein